MRACVHACVCVCVLGVCVCVCVCVVDNKVNTEQQTTSSETLFQCLCLFDIVSGDITYDTNEFSAVISSMLFRGSVQ